MPPCAAFECERTGWTLERMPTDAPSAAAARAARWPARPAPMTSTSCSGMRRPGVYSDGGRGRLERPAHLVERDAAPQPAVVVHGHHHPEALEALGGEQGLEGLVDPDPVGLVGVRHHHLA